MRADFQESWPPYLEVLLLKVALEVLCKLEAGKSMESRHCVCSILSDHQWLSMRLSPPSQRRDNLPGDQLGVAWIGVPGGVLVHPNDVHMASHVIRGIVLVRVVILHSSNWSGLV